MHKYRADLHIHTVLSPCADIEMIPPLIVKEAISKSIDIIAITDHNAIANIEAVQKAAIGTELSVIAGLEIQTREEVHTICLFNSIDDCKNFYSELKQFLPPLSNNPEFFGEQFIVDETGNYICREDQLLIISINLSLEDTFKMVKKYRGLFIPAHIDNKTFGLIGHLGILPDTIQFDALEISKNIDHHTIKNKFENTKNFPLIKNSDAHQLDEIQGFNEFNIQTPSLEEISLALQGMNYRSFKVK